MKKNVDMYLTGRLGEGIMTMKFLDHGVNFVNVNVNYARLDMSKKRVRDMLNRMMSKQELTTLNVTYVYFDESYLNRKFSTALGLINHKPIKDKHVLFFGRIKTCDRVDVRRILPEDAKDTVPGVKGETPSGFRISFKEGSIVPEITPFFGYTSEQRNIMQVSSEQMMDDVQKAMLNNIADNVSTRNLVVTHGSLENNILDHRTIKDSIKDILNNYGIDVINIISGSMFNNFLLEHRKLKDGVINGFFNIRFGEQNSINCNEFSVIVLYKGNQPILGNNLVRMLTKDIRLNNPRFEFITHKPE